MGAPRRASDPAPSRRELFGLRRERAVVPAEPRVAAIAATCLSMLGTACRVCAEHCDRYAIRFRLALGGKSIPSVGESCDGCDACRPVCPVGAIALVPKPEAAPCA